MKHVFQAHTVAEGAEIQMLRGALEDAGVPCLIRNESLAMASGYIPCTECFPELWVMNDADFAKAEEIVTSWRRSSSAAQAPWQCPGCAETMEGQFTSCWKCGTEQA
jgi:hypothetical protein